MLEHSEARDNETPQTIPPQRESFHHGGNHPAMEGIISPQRATAAVSIFTVGTAADTRAQHLAGSESQPVCGAGSWCWAVVALYPEVPSMAQISESLPASCSFGGASTEWTKQVRKRALAIRHWPGVPLSCGVSASLARALGQSTAVGTTNRKPTPTPQPGSRLSR